MIAGILTMAAQRRYLREAFFFRLLLLNRLGRYRAPTCPARGP